MFDFGDLLDRLELELEQEEQDLWFAPEDEEQDDWVELEDEAYPRMTGETKVYN